MPTSLRSPKCQIHQAKPPLCLTPHDKTWQPEEGQLPSPIEPRHSIAPGFPETDFT